MRITSTKYLSNQKVASKEFGYNDVSNKGTGFINFFITTKEVTYEDGTTAIVSTYTKNDARDYAFYNRSTEYATETRFKAAIKRVGAI